MKPKIELVWSGVMITVALMVKPFDGVSLAMLGVGITFLIGGWVSLKTK